MSLSGHVHHFALVISIYDLVIFIDDISLLLAPINLVDLTIEQPHSPLTTVDFTITILGSGYMIGIMEHILWVGTFPGKTSNTSN